MELVNNNKKYIQQHAQECEMGVNCMSVAVIARGEAECDYRLTSALIPKSHAPGSAVIN